MDAKTKTKTAIARPKTPDFTEQLIEPFTQLKSEVDRLFESFPFQVPMFSLGRFTSVPALEMTETGKAYKLTAEIPGIDPADIEVNFEDGLLRIAGEKKEEREENERGYSFSERTYGSFERLVTLPKAANPDKIQAKFRNGVLTVTVEKDGTEKSNVRQIKVEKQA